MYLVQSWITSGCAEYRTSVLWYISCVFYNSYYTLLDTFNQPAPFFPFLCLMIPVQTQIIVSSLLFSTKLLGRTVYFYYFNSLDGLWGLFCLAKSMWKRTCTKLNVIHTGDFSDVHVCYRLPWISKWTEVLRNIICSFFSNLIENLLIYTIFILYLFILYNIHIIYIYIILFKKVWHLAGFQ
jgi:hypothetical protein